MNAPQDALFRIRSAIEVATMVRRRAGEALPDDWASVIDGAFPCLAEECPGWLDSAERDPSVMRNLVRCACGEFRTRLAPLLGLRLLDVPPLNAGSLSAVLESPPPLAWQVAAEVTSLTAMVWGFLCRRAVAKGSLVSVTPERATPAQRRTAEVVAGLELYQRLFFDDEMAFLPGHFLRRSFLPPAIPGALPWVSCGRLAVVVLDAFLGRPPWSAISSEVKAFEVLVNELARRGAGLLVFSTCELVTRRATRTSYVPDYATSPVRGRMPGRRTPRAGEKGAVIPEPEARIPSMEELLHPSSMDRLWEVLAQGQGYLDGLGPASSRV